MCYKMKSHLLQSRKNVFRIRCSNAPHIIPRKSSVIKKKYKNSRLVCYKRSSREKSISSVLINRLKQDRQIKRRWITCSNIMRFINWRRRDALVSWNVFNRSARNKSVLINRHSRWICRSWKSNLSYKRPKILN